MRACGILLMVLGVVFGVWAGVGWAFIGGIVQIVHSVQASPIDGLGIALGFLRWTAAGFIGAVTFYVFFVPGYSFFITAKN